MTTFDTDLDAVAATAISLIDDVRDGDPQLTRDVLACLCRAEPGRMAQVMMTLAVWIDPEETVTELGDRAERVAAGLAQTVQRAVPVSVCAHCGELMTLRNGYRPDGTARWRCGPCVRARRKAAA